MNLIIDYIYIHTRAMHFNWQEIIEHSYRNRLNPNDLILKLLRLEVPLGMFKCLISLQKRILNRDEGSYETLKKNSLFSKLKWYKVITRIDNPGDISGLKHNCWIQPLKVVQQYIIYYFGYSRHKKNWVASITGVKPNFLKDIIHSLTSPHKA